MSDGTTASNPGDAGSPPQANDGHRDVPNRTQSYVYPVRSLLAGIQPAEMQEQIDRLPSADSSRYSLGLRSGSLNVRSPSNTSSPQDAFFPPHNTLATPTELDESDITSPFISPSFKSSASPPPETSQYVSQSGTRRRSKRRGREAESPSARSTSSDPAMRGETSGSVVISPHGTAMEYVSQADRDDEQEDHRHPEPITSALADALFDSSADIGSFASLSQHGYVHLSPIHSPAESKRGSAKGSGVGSAGSVLAFPKLSVNARTASGSNEPESASSGNESENKEEGLAASDASESVGVVQASDSRAGNVRSDKNSLTDAKSEDPLVTFRFQHVQNDDGHHVIVGREGTLTRCEDEPIRVPGAVQGFGVMIAVDDSEQQDVLVVRQVSENATELLGLSPKYLFSLDCFTDTLPESQIDILWDNLQFLTEQYEDADQGTDDSPQVFLLSGYGEPGSAIFDDEAPDSSHTKNRKQMRRQWTCWCAVHRPPSSGRNRNLIVLELELERDMYNPLHPPLPVSKNTNSSASTPGSTTSGSDGRGVGSDDSATTIGAFVAGRPTDSAISTGTSNSVQSDADNVESTSPSTLSRTLSNMTERYMTASHRVATDDVQGLVGDDKWFPSAAEFFESTTNKAKPLRALDRMRRMGEPRDNAPRRGRRGRRSRQGAGVGTMDIFSVLAQVNEQLAAAQDLDAFLKIVVGIIKDLTQFHRVLIYQFDEHWNGQVVAELVDWNQTHDLYKSLHFPASDIPAQARQLYAINKVRLLYDRDLPTARLVVRSKADMEEPLDMTHSFLRAMSPIHIKYLGNMGVRASMSVSIITFGALWGLIACHSYGGHGMRVSFPVRQMLRLLSDSISRNIERLSYAQRLHTRKLISTLSTDQHPTGHIVTKAEDLLSLFDADFGVLVIGEGAKILGPNEHSQDILVVSEYMRLKQFKMMQVSQSVKKDFPDLHIFSGMDVIAGLLYVPLSSSGKDFITFLRKGQLRQVHWAGKPFKEGYESNASLEPRKSFKAWSETVAGRCRAWTDEQLETAGVLSLVYGKFIEVWRQKESALQTTQLTNILLSNASHEVRTPLNHIINYLEMALNGPLDAETRDNLKSSHLASKGLLFTINDLLDLTRLESGNETSFNEPFNLHEVVKDAVQLYSLEAKRRNLTFGVKVNESPEFVIGDARKIRTLVSNVTANAVKYTSFGHINVECRKFAEPRGLRHPKEVVIEIVITDTGCGIPAEQLENIFRDFERVESETPQSDKAHKGSSLSLGLAVVARIIEQVKGQMRVDSKPGHGSKFSFLLNFSIGGDRSTDNLSSDASSIGSKAALQRLRSSHTSSDGSEVDNVVDALSASHMVDEKGNDEVVTLSRKSSHKEAPYEGKIEVKDSNYPIRSLKMDEFDLDKPINLGRDLTPPFHNVDATEFARQSSATITGVASQKPTLMQSGQTLVKFRCLVVEDDSINRTILCKRLKMDGHIAIATTNGLEGAEAVEKDGSFDCILMDIQMPILDGFESTKRIREYERNNPVVRDVQRRSLQLNGRIPIFAVSASLKESQHQDMLERGLDGWILKPIDFKRLRTILRGIDELELRKQNLYHPGYSWESGGWLHDAPA